MEKTKVVLRRWRKDGGIVAILPEVPADDSGMRCIAYDGVTHREFRTRLGAVVRVTTPVSDQEQQECAEVLTELQELGYKRLTQSPFIGYGSIIKLFSTRKH